jgi:hypothetical protein
MRERTIGKSANSWIENSINANTEVSFRRRDANTREAEIAAFMDNTAVKL